MNHATKNSPEIQEAHEEGNLEEDAMEARFWESIGRQTTNWEQAKETPAEAQQEEGEG